MRTGEWVVAENWRLCSTTLVVRGVAGELEDEKFVFFRELFLAPCTLLLPLPAAQMLTTMSWAVTAWPPVGGLGGRITHTDTHTLPQLTRTHTYADSFPHGHRHTHRNPHTTSTNSTSHFSLHTYRITRTLTSYVMKNAFGPLVV